MGASTLAAHFTENEWRIIGLTSVGHALCHVSELSFAAVLTAVMAEFALSSDQATALAVPGFVLYGVGAIPAGLWTDRRGSREVLMFYFFAVAVSSLLVVFATTAWQVAAALAALGAAISLYHPAGLGMISLGCTHRGRALGVNGVAGSLGISLGPALALTLASYGYWRAIYAVIAAFGLLGLVFGAVLKLDVEPHLQKVSPTDDSHASRDAPLESALPRLSVFVLLFVAMMLGGINYRSFTTALPPFLTAEYDTSVVDADVNGDGQMGAELTDHFQGLASVSVLVVLALGIPGQLIGGHLADRFRPAVVYPLMIASTIPCALVMANGKMPLVIVAAGALAVFMFAQQPLENLMIARATPPNWRSTVYGLKFVLAFGVASLGAYLTGWVWDRYHLSMVFNVLAGVAVGMATIAGIYAFATRPNP